jgi:plasmid stabilization system protein ParE
MYRITYLLTAKLEILDIVDYISEKLYNPIAADKLLKKINHAIHGLASFPYMYQVQQFAKPTEQEYRRLPVNNYLIFYYVDEAAKLVTIARVIYSKRNLNKLI